jgi:hypothetical protein
MLDLHDGLRSVVGKKGGGQQSGNKKARLMPLLISACVAPQHYHLLCVASSRSFVVVESIESTASGK